ncbi:TPA: hypothetical protein ACPWZ0_004199 [Salmonella enterica subsp. enterica serovar Vietnam]|nr:hypothetical protein [Salmonella enterica]
MTNLAIIWGIIEALFSIIFILCYSNFRKLWGGCLLSLCVSLASFLVWCESYYGRWDDGTMGRWDDGTMVESMV